MSKLYATATATANGRTIRLPVEVGEVDSPDGVVFDTSMPAGASTVSVPVTVTPRAHQHPVRPTKAQVKAKRKKERQNRKKGRR